MVFSKEASSHEPSSHAEQRVMCTMLPQPGGAGGGGGGGGQMDNRAKTRYKSIQSLIYNRMRHERIQNHIRHERSESAPGQRTELYKSDQ